MTRMRAHRDVASRSRALAQRLALRVVRDRDKDAAKVLGDLIMERGLRGVETGRKRAVFFTAKLNAQTNYPEIHPTIDEKFNMRSRDRNGKRS